MHIILESCKFVHNGIFSGGGYSYTANNNYVVCAHVTNIDVPVYYQRNLQKVMCFIQNTFVTFSWKNDISYETTLRYNFPAGIFDVDSTSKKR